MNKDSRGERLFTYRSLDSALDAMNLRLLAELQREPRLTMAELGRRAGLSSPAVTERIRRLEEAGVIAGYRLDLDPSALGLPLAAYIRVRPNPGQLPRIAELARGAGEGGAAPARTGRSRWSWRRRAGSGRGPGRVDPGPGGGL
jgi:Lrp/AsnC family leucine-responsive transcriptional regulator